MTLNCIWGCCVVVAFLFFVYVMRHEPLIGDGDDQSLKEINDKHLSEKEKDFYKQVQKHKQNGKKN